jgi:hypothetical protein
MIEEIKNSAIADGTLLTKNWDTEPLLPLVQNVATIPETRFVLLDSLDSDNVVF